VGELPGILFVATPGPLGGSNRSLLTLFGQLEGRVTRILAAPAHGAFTDLVRERNLVEEYVVLPRRPHHWTDRWLRLVAGGRIAWWLVRNRHRVAAIHANALTGLNLATPAAVVSRVPVVAWIHDPTGSTWGSRIGPLVRRLVPRLRLAAVSTTAEASAVANGLCRPGDAAIVPNPIDPADVVAPGRADRDTVVVEDDDMVVKDDDDTVVEDDDDMVVKDDGDPVTVGFLGGVTHRKGFDLVPRVVEALVDEPVRLLLYVNLGRRGASPAIWEQLDRWGPDRVEPVGRLDDVRGAYAAVDIVWVASRAESFCRVAAEAMINGIPVVAGDIPPLRDLLGEDEAGLLYPVEDPAAAAAALRRLVHDPGLRRSLGQAGRDRSRSFSPEEVASSLLELYGLSSASRPAS
jgi:glycosyltransferase involved in cell wall biosynthesis